MSRKNEEDDEYSDAHAIARRALLGRMRGRDGQFEKGTGSSSAYHLRGAGMGSKAV
ncbi:MAG TPA: hypothetical protein PL065_02090 [Polyangiaceae bacterium]|nr:hypothetical protein [Polyangiaceae bacterium]